MTEAEYTFDPIYGIEVSDGLDVFIHYAPQQRVLVKAGKNILPDIELRQVESTLYIQDNNQCNWSRSYEAREVHVYISKLKRVIQHGFGSISSVDTIPSEDLYVYARIGSGNIDLTLKSNHVEVISSRYGTIRLRGETKGLKVSYLDNNAIFDGRALKAENIEILHKSNNDFHLYPIQSLTGKIMMRGNVYLYQKPQHIDVQDTGHGEIILSLY